eukprot:g3410.t1
MYLFHQRDKAPHSGTLVRKEPRNNVSGKPDVYLAVEVANGEVVKEETVRKDGYIEMSTQKNVKGFLREKYTFPAAFVHQRNKGPNFTMLRSAPNKAKTWVKNANNQVQNGEIVFRLKTDNDFALVRTSKGVEGYIRTSYLYPSIRVHRRTKAPDGTYIRKKADDAYQFISSDEKEVKKDEVVYVLGFGPKKKYALIRRANHPDAHGYVRTEYLATVPTFSHQRPPSDKYKYSTLRMTASDSKDFVSGTCCDPKVNNGDVVFKLKESGSYSRVLTSSGCRGYVRTKYLSKTASIVPKLPTPITRGGTASTGGGAASTGGGATNTTSSGGSSAVFTAQSHLAGNGASIFSSAMKDIPEHWIPMKPKENRKVVDLQEHIKKLRKDIKDLKKQMQTAASTTLQKSLSQKEKEVATVEKRYKEIATRFASTLGGKKIHRISRIQNRYLFQRFERAKRLIERNNTSKQADVKELFHGTRNTDPKLIYYGKNSAGFDPHLGKGYYGTGAYFAEKAAYSHSYAHPANGRRYMFLAYVACGNIKNYGMKKMTSLKRGPDLEPGHPDYGGQWSPGLYDSVQGGPHSGSVMYIVYNGEQAYPAYLIEYS